MRFLDWLPSDPMTLADIAPGTLVRISNMDALSVEKRDQMLAFGLTAGRWVEIKQHRPAVVIQVDYTELAIEPEVALAITVETPISVHRMRHFRRGATARGRRHGRGRFSFGRKRRKRRARFLSRWIRRRMQKRDNDK
jgi:Fe2+ transport system protein FeoA